MLTQWKNKKILPFKALTAAIEKKIIKNRNEEANTKSF